MGIQPMHNSSWLRLTLNEVENRLGNLIKPIGSMNLDELLKIVWTTEANHSSGNDHIISSPVASLSRALSRKTVDEVWRDIEKGYKTRSLEDKCSRELTFGKMTLEDFLVKGGMYACNASIEPVMSLDSALRAHELTGLLLLSPSPSTDDFSDTTIPGRKRIDLEKAIERRLRRKIKNRESAARSRAKKQAYYNELVTKVSGLGEENLKLKKEKEFVEMVSCDLSEPRYQLRRTSSF